MFQASVINHGFATEANNKNKAKSFVAAVIFVIQLYAIILKVCVAFSVMLIAAVKTRKSESHEISRVIRSAYQINTLSEIRFRKRNFYLMLVCK